MAADPHHLSNVLLRCAQVIMAVTVKGRKPAFPADTPPEFAVRNPSALVKMTDLFTKMAHVATMPFGIVCPVEQRFDILLIGHICHGSSWLCRLKSFAFVAFCTGLYC